MSPYLNSVVCPKITVRSIRHAWPDVLVVKGDKESLAGSVQSIRFSHPYVQRAIFFSDDGTFENEIEFGHSQSVFRAHSSLCANSCFSLLRDKWPTVRVLVFLEVSSAQSQFATFFFQISTREWITSAWTLPVFVPLNV